MRGMRVGRERGDVMCGEEERSLSIVEMHKTQKWRQELLNK